MKQISRILFMTIALVVVVSTSSCTRNNIYKVKRVQPKKRFGFYDGKKDRRKKRTKVVTYKVHRGIKY